MNLSSISNPGLFAAQKKSPASSKKSASPKKKGASPGGGAANKYLVGAMNATRGQAIYTHKPSSNFNFAAEQHQQRP